MAAAGLDLGSAASSEVHRAAEQAAPFTDAAASTGKAGGLTSSKLIAIAGAGLGLCVAVVAVVYFVFGGISPPPDKPPIVTPAADQPAAVNPPRRSVHVALNESWLPTETQMIVSLQWSGLTRNPQFAWLQQRLHPAVGQELESICETLTIEQKHISRASWAVTQVANPAQGDVWMIELSEGISGQDDLLARATPLDFELGAYRVYQFPDAGWSHPFAIVDRQRVVTGDEDTLRALAAREASSVASDALKNLLQHVGVGRDLTVLVDLQAVEDQNVDLPATWIENWGEVGKRWRQLRSSADGVALGLDFGNLLVAQVDFLSGAANAHDIQLAVDDLMSAADPWMTAELQSLQERLREGEFNDRVARKIRILVERGLDALSTSETGVEQVNEDLALVWIRARTDEQLSQLASAAISSVPAWEARRLTSARALDQAKLRSLIRGLRGYEKVSGSFPPGAAGTSAVPAERRLSWMAQLLPYYEPQAGWKDELSFSRPWNVAPNDAVARRHLPAVINPAIGLEHTADGYPVTHYVGVAGLGADAGSMPAGHGRAGVFGFDRQISLLELTGHASQTMAIAGVSQQLGPWARGGNATVRPFTVEPYINGPDGFGSGQADGMFAAMADGSARFVNKDIDPNVFRQLIVVGGPKPDPPAVAVNPDRGDPPVGVDPPENGNNDAEGAANPPADNANAVANIGPPPNGRARRDLRDRLAFPLPSVSFRQQPLQEVVEFLANTSGVGIQIDPERLAAVGTTPQERISINLESTNVGEALKAILSDLGLNYVVQGDRLLVTAAGAGPLAVSQATYDLDQLAETDEQKIALEELIRKFVMPSAWDVAGGPADLGMSDHDLVVNHTAAGHAELAQFLGRLRVARGHSGADVLQTQTWLPVKLETVYSRSKIARAMPVNANFFQPTPLLRITNHLAQKSQVEILLDAPAMRNAGVEILRAVELKMANTTLEQALRELASKLELTVVALDDRTMMLTSRFAAESDYATEFLSVGELLSDVRTPESLESGLQQRLPEPPTDQPPYTVYYDSASQCFIIRAPQAQLFAAEQWLDSLRQ
mgnify:CR=1 FL=1